MTVRPTYCRICEAACGLLADVRDGRLESLGPDPKHVASRGFVCAKGVHFLSVHQDPDRVDVPLRRQGATLQPTSWDQSLTEIGTKLRQIRRQHGPHAVAVYIGNPAAFSYATPVFSAGFVRALGTRNHFNASSLDCSNKFVVAHRMLGSPLSHPVPDLDHANFALLIGTNPSVSQSSFVNAPHIIARLRGIERRGGVVVVDPRRTETARRVGDHVPIVPDTDAALLLSLLKVIFDEGLERPEVVERHALGIEKLRDAVRSFDPERVAAITRVPASRIRDIARRFARTHGAFCHVSTGVNQGRFGNIAYAAKIALELVTGNLDRRGGALMPRGAIDLAALAHRLGYHREPQWRSRIGNLPPVLGALPSAIFPDEVLTPGEGQIRALVVIAGNPLLSMPGGERLRQALRQLDLLVVMDLYVNDTAAYATHILPCTDWLEREDLPLSQLQLQPVPYVQWTEPVATPRGERRPEWRILLDLAKTAGMPMFGKRAADVALRTAARLAGPKALVMPLLIPVLGLRPLKKLRLHPHGVLIDREPNGQFLKRRIRTRWKRVDLFPQEVYSRLPELESTLGKPRAHDVSLRLFTKRERLGHNSWMHNSPKLKTGEHRAHISPADAKRLRFHSGDTLRLTTDAGTIELPAVIDRDIIPGAIAISHGYGHEKSSGWSGAKTRGGANVNILAASGVDAVDPLSGMCRFIGIQVRVERVERPLAERPSGASALQACRETR